jgi:hypothetical protein
MLPLCLYVTPFLSKVAGSGNSEDGYAGWIFVPLSITCIFGLQWLVLRRHIPKATRWIWGNSSALILGGLLLAVISRFINATAFPEWSLAAIAAFSYGLLLGLTHWLIFKEYSPNVFFWIALNCGALVLVALIFGGSIHSNIRIALFSGVPAVFIGLALLWALRAKRVSALA